MQEVMMDLILYLILVPLIFASLAFYISSKVISKKLHSSTPKITRFSIYFTGGYVPLILIIFAMLFVSPNLIKIDENNEVVLTLVSLFLAFVGILSTAISSASNSYDEYCKENIEKEKNKSLELDNLKNELKIIRDENQKLLTLNSEIHKKLNTMCLQTNKEQTDKQAMSSKTINLININKR